MSIGAQERSRVTHHASRIRLLYYWHGYIYTKWGIYSPKIRVLYLP